MSIYQQIFNQPSSSKNIYGFLLDKGFVKIDSSHFERSINPDLKIKIFYNEEKQTLHLRVFYRDVARNSYRYFQFESTDVVRADQSLRDATLAIKINGWM